MLPHHTCARSHASSCESTNAWLIFFAALSQTMAVCSPDGARRNPGFSRLDNAVPDYASLHPGYYEFADSKKVESERHTSLVSKIKRSAPPLANFGTSPAAALPASLPNAFWMSPTLSKLRMATR